MKILLILFLTTFGFSAIAGQNDWKKTEHNYNLKYKEYVHVEESNLKKSVVHANTMYALLKQTPGGFQYDSWFESLPKNAKFNLSGLKVFA